MDSIWTLELYQEATDNFQFIIVTPIGLPRANVTDIKPIWTLYGDFIFNTKYRIGGRRDDNIKKMGNVGYDEDQLDQIISDIDNNSLTNDNFESLMEDENPVYDLEVAGYEQWKDQFLESQTGAKGLTLLELLKKINPHMSMVEERKVVPRIPTGTAGTTGSGRGAAGIGKATPSPKGKVGRKSTALQDKVDKALDDNKIINVTNITATGTGTTTSVRRGRTSLFVAPNLPITSSKLAGVLTAIELLGGEDEHPEDFQAAMDFKWKDDNTSPKTTPKTTNTTSTTSTTRNLIAPSKTVVPEAVQPVRRNLLPPPGKGPKMLVTETSDI